MIRLFYVGDRFYWDSSTSMSSIYVVGTFARYDWGFVQQALKRGEEIHIRQAGPEELRWAEDKLEAIKDENSRRHAVQS